MRMLRGSGIAGLAAMARETEREGVWLARPLLDVPKSQLVATLGRAKIAFADDPTNRDMSFTRPRLRALMPALAEEGGDSRNLARLAARLARANAAIEVLADGAERYLALRDRDDASRFGFDAGAFAGCPRKSGFGCSSARSTGPATRGLRNSARSKRCWRCWTGRLRMARGRRG